MAKINKIYPPFFNGVSQQNPELILDNQCKEMINCVPSVISGITKRPPVVFKKNYDFTPQWQDAKATTFHTYDRGEDDEEYIMLQTNEVDNPVLVLDKAGELQTVEYATGKAGVIRDYLNNGKLKGLTVQDRTWVFSKDATVDLDYTVDPNDPTTTALRPNYKKEAFYWLKRASGDKYNPYNYAVYLEGILATDEIQTFEVDPVKMTPSTNLVYDPDASNSTGGSGALVEDPTKGGAENSEFAADILVTKINKAKKGYIAAVVGSLIKIIKINPGEDPRQYREEMGGEVPPYKKADGEFDCDAAHDEDKLSFLRNKSVYNDVTNEFEYTTYAETEYPECNASFIPTDAYGDPLPADPVHTGELLEFRFSSWDSFGDQASEGWKGSVNKITDLPRDMPYKDVFVEIKGEEGQEATNYYVKWNGSTWEETRDPEIKRGKLFNMPVKLDRTSIDPNTGIATFTFDTIEWSKPLVGNLENNPDPSFAPSPPSNKYFPADEADNRIKRKIHDLFFYKNRLGIASEDSVTLSETANYTNFYTTTAIDTIDTDLIDITLATEQASKIYYVKPFNNSLYVFTKFAQYEITHNGSFSPSTVSLNNTTNYPMAVEVEPLIINDSLYFISNTDKQQQLREYIQTDKFKVKGIDLNVSTPTYLEEPITNLVADGILGYVLCCTAKNKVYLYNYKEDGTQRIQSAWSTWTVLNELAGSEEILPESFGYYALGSTLVIACKTTDDYRFHHLQLDYKAGLEPDTFVDTTQSNNLLTPDVNNLLTYEAKVVLPDYYPQISGIRTPLNKVLIKKITVEGEGSFDSEVYRKDYDTTYLKEHSGSLKDYDIHIASKVGNVVITLKDATANDFKITSIILEGLYQQTSKELK